MADAPDACGGAAGVVGYPVIVILGVIGADRVTASQSGFTARDFADALLPVAAIAWLAVCAIFASHTNTAVIALNYVIYWVPPVLIGACICYALDRE